VHSVGQLSVGESSGSSSIVGDGVGSNSVSDENGGIGIRVAAHVLEHNVANQLGIDSTSVLGSPLNRQKRSFVE